MTGKIILRKTGRMGLQGLRLGVASSARDNHGGVQQPRSFPAAILAVVVLWR